MHHHARKQFLHAVGISLLIVPALGLALTELFWSAKLSPDSILLAVMASASFVHLASVLGTESSAKNKITLHLLASLFSFGLMVAVIFFVHNPIPEALSLRLLTSAWILGAMIGLGGRAIYKLGLGGSTGAVAIGLILAVEICLLTFGLWGAGKALQLMLPSLYWPSPLICGLLALLLLAALAPLERAMADFSAETVPPPPIMPPLALLSALVVVLGAASLGEINELGLGGVTLVTAMGAALMTGLLLRLAPIALTIALLLGLLLSTLILALEPGEDGSSFPLIAITAALLISTIFLNQERKQAAQRMVFSAGHPSPEVLLRFNKMTESVILRIDLQARMVHFPWGSGATFGHGASASFAEFFLNTEYSGILDLLARLHQPGNQSDEPLYLHLTTPKNANGETLQRFRVHVLEPLPNGAWLAVQSQRNVTEISRRSSDYEERLGAAILREERLLSLASHELRTPIAILSMLTEELKSGMDWQDVGQGFEKTLNRVVSILDDLRADSGASGGLAAQTSFTVREMASQLLEVFTAAAESNGISLKTNLPLQSDIAIRSDYGRIYTALSKLIHNAITHSKGHEVMLTVFVTTGAEGEMTVTWQVSDDGIGIPAEAQDRVFEPFERASTDHGEQSGLGLYTARKAIRLIGGDLNLQTEGKGARFVMSHPARLEQAVKPSEQDQNRMSDAISTFPNLAVLLVEDNKLVGEITMARLKKLFGRVDWAEAGDTGLQQFRAAHYDFVIVDQLMPGMVGSDLVREIRKSHPDVPIVGITASTLGTECQELEAAGANFALEKPLSFSQIKGLAEEFFGPGESPA